MDNDYKEIYISVLKEIERLREEEQKLDISDDDSFVVGENYGKVIAYTDMLLLMYKEFLMSEDVE